MNWGRKRHMETKRKDGHKPKKDREDIKKESGERERQTENIRREKKYS